MADETQVTEPTQPTPYIDRVYSALKDNLTGFNKTPEQFKEAMKDSTYASKAYTALKDNLTGFDKTPEDFYGQVGVKKKVPTTPDSPITSPLLSNGLIPSQSSQDNTIGITDPHLKAIAKAQQYSQVTQPKPIIAPKKEDEGVIDKIGQALYLPAFNKGFNDLVVKPAAGATDFIDRSIDKLYTGITGEETPSWLRKKGAFDAITNYYDKAYDERKKPSNIASESAENVVGAVPLVLSMFSGTGEATLATKAPTLFSGLTKTLATTQGLNAYKESTDQNKGYIQSLTNAGVGAGKGALEGMSMEAQMLVGGAMGTGVANKLAEKGLLGGKIGEKVLHALSVGTVFGGTSVAGDVLNGKDIDTHEALKQFGTGLAFEVIPTVKSIAEHVGEKVANNKLNEQALQTAAVSNAASNLHAESVVRTLTQTPIDQLLSINENIKDGHEDLYANSLEAGVKSIDAKTPTEKKQFLADQLLLKTQGDVKYLADKVKDNPDELIQQVQQTNEISPEQKQELTEKITALSEQQKQLTNDIQPETNTPVENNVPETPQTNETGVPTSGSEEPVETNTTINNNINQESNGSTQKTTNEVPESSGQENDGNQTGEVEGHRSVAEKEKVTNSGEGNASPVRFTSADLYKDANGEQSSTKDNPLHADGTNVASSDYVAANLRNGDKVKFFAEKERTGTWNAEKGQIVDDKGNPWGTVAILNHPDGYIEKINNEPTANTGGTKPVTEQVQQPETQSKAIEANKEKIPAGDTGAQKAIDLVNHGVLGVENVKAGETAPRIDFGMDAKERNKAVSDIAKGDYETAPAKKLLAKIQEFEANGEYPVIEGKGGTTIRAKGIPASEIGNMLDDAKGLTLPKELTAEQILEFNKHAEELGITAQDIHDYEQFRNGTTGNNGSTVESPTETIQRSQDDKATSDSQNTGSKATQIKKQSLTDVELQRKLELRKKFSGRLNDITGVPALLADKEFREYTGLVFKEAAGDFKNFSKELIENVGDKIKDHLPQLFKDFGGEIKPLTQEKVLNDTKPADTNEQPVEATYGTKNAITESLRDGLGLPPIEIPKDRSEDASLNAWKNGTRTPTDIINGLLSDKDIYEKSITPNDEPIVREYTKQLIERKNELNKILADVQEKGDKETEATVQQQIQNNHDLIENALNASKIAGNIWHKFGQERQLAIDEQGLVLNSIERIKSIYGKDIPTEVKKQLTDLQLKYDNILAQNAKIEETLKKKTAEQVFEKAKPKRGLLGTNRVKKTDVEFKQERATIIEQMKRDFKKSLGQLNATLPGVPQLNAIAPHVAALMRSFAEQGITKVDDAILKVHDIIKDVVDGITKEDIRDIIAGKYSEKKTISELQKEVNDLRTQARSKLKIEELENGIAPLVKKKGQSSPEVQELQKRIAELKKTAPNEHVELSIADLKQQIRMIQGKIDKGDYFKMPNVKRQWETDPKWIENNKEKAKLNFQLRKLEREALDSKKGRGMRFLDWNVRWGRRVIFFGANAVYTKLASAAVLGSFVHRLPEQALGKLNAKMFPHIARNAPIEGNFNIEAEAKFYKEFLNVKNLAKNTFDIFKTGETPLSRELGKQLPHNHIPVIDLFAADAHIMIKDPVKRAVFESSMISQLQWYADHNVDATHPLLLESARQAAYKRAEYEIFQNSEPNSNKIKQFFGQLEKEAVINKQMPDIWNKHVKSNLQYTTAALYHFFIPVNTVPVNILKRVGLGLKLPITYIEAMSKNKAVKDGIMNMTLEESDALMLQLKKGQIAAAYWTLGFILAGAGQVGGLYTNFYSNKERDKTVDVPESDFLHLGVDISKNVQHNTQLQSMQMAATWRIVYDHYIDDKGESQIQSILAATSATAGVAAKEHPVIEAASKLNEAIQTPHGNTKFVKDLKRRIGINKAQDVLKLMGYDIGDDTD